MAKRIPWILLCISLFLSLWLFARQLELPSGGGQGFASPNGRYFASASSEANYRLSEYRDIYGKLEIREGSETGPIITTILIRPERVPSPFEYRNIDNLIEWAKDSSQVTFRTPSGVYTLKVPK